VSRLLLDVRNLAVAFPTNAGDIKAVDDVSFTVERGKVLGLVGESGSGKSVTGCSIIKLIEPPGRITAGQILFDGIDLAGLNAEEMRRLRGKRIAMIFQDPMMTLNPVLRIDTQMIEAITAHEPVSHAAARARAGCSGPGWYPRPRRAALCLSARIFRRDASTRRDRDCAAASA
jgi:peptide/nickel transport system ATP-binding protein